MKRYLDRQLGRELSEKLPWGPPLAWWQLACFAVYVGGFVWVARLLAEVARAAG